MHAQMAGSLMDESKEAGSVYNSTLEDDEVRLPSEVDYKTLLEEHATFDTSDPSLKYDITSKHKLGIGGFAKVFRVIRRSDGLNCALKFIQLQFKLGNQFLLSTLHFSNRFNQ